MDGFRDQGSRGRSTGASRRRLRLLGAFGAAALALALAGATASQALAHGSMADPLSRTYGCYLENPEQPSSDACADAIAIGGTQPLYDWMEVNLSDAGGRHRELIPDGELCSAGRDKYRGFDQARNDWPATELVAGSRYTMRYRAWVAHSGDFDVYVTRDDYDPTEPLRWSDLESKPFLSVSHPALVDGDYVLAGRLPEGKTGRHLIYAIWQRDDSLEAFYSCSDVVFRSSSGGRTLSLEARAGRRPDRPIKVTVGCRRACKVRLAGRAVARGGGEPRRRFSLKGARRKLRAGQSAKLKLRVKGRRNRRALLRRVRGGGSAKARIEATATDGSGVSSSRTARVRLR